ncbi:MAG: hypothetical protein ABI680_01945 [Chthoniobacteraceae bacterium]
MKKHFLPTYAATLITIILVALGDHFAPAGDAPHRLVFDSIIVNNGVAYYVVNGVAKVLDNRVIPEGMMMLPDGRIVGAPVEVKGVEESLTIAQPEVEDVRNKLRKNKIQGASGGSAGRLTTGSATGGGR